MIHSNITKTTQMKSKQIQKHFSRLIRPKPSRKPTLEPQKQYTRNTILKIYTILKYSSWETAKQEITKLNIKWDSFTVNQILKTHPPMQKAWIFFNWVSSKIKHDHFTYTSMINIFGEAGRIDSMYYLFNQMKEMGLKIDAFTYTSVMHWVSRNGDVDEAIKIWKEMKRNGFGGSVVSYTAFIKILLENNRVDDGVQVYKEMIEKGVLPNCFTYTVLMEFLVGSGKCAEAVDMFSEMQEAGVQPDKAMCNILVEKCCKVGEISTMTGILQYMKENHLTLRYPVFSEALKTLRSAGESDALLKQVNPHCASESIENDGSTELAENDNDPIDKGLLLILLKKQSLVAVDRLLSEVITKNMIMESWILSAIIEANCSQCRVDSALLAFDYCVRMGIDLDRTAYLALIGNLMRSSTFSRVVNIFEEMMRVGHSLELYLNAALIYRLGTARRPNCAAKIFDILPEEQKCTATFTAMISVYFSAGSPEKALKIYKTMKKKGINPSLGTYNTLLIGLERSGRNFETDNLRKEKKKLIATVYRNGFSADEKICDLLFAGSLVP